MSPDAVPRRVQAAIDAAWGTNGWHPCPGCGEPATPGSVGCSACWLAIPADKRHLLAAAFRQRLTNPDVYRAACAEAADLMAGAS